MQTETKHIHTENPLTKHTQNKTNKQN